MRDCEKQLMGFLFLQNLLGFFIFNQLSVYFSTVKFYQGTFQWFQQEMLSSQIITVKVDK